MAENGNIGNEGDSQFTGVDFVTVKKIGKLYHMGGKPFREGLTEVETAFRSDIPAIHKSARRVLKTLVKEGVISQDYFDQLKNK